MKRNFEIYIHIPFCARKCGYCDFLSFPAEKRTRRAYVDALLSEIRAEKEQMRKQPVGVRDEDRMITSVFIGGGTPSLLPAAWIAEILEALRQRFLFAEDPEITMEANPGTLEGCGAEPAEGEALSGGGGKLRAYRAAGINRLSLGLQSAHDAELAALGRIHRYEEFLMSFRAARAAGFDNINVDLMFGIPGQTADSWEQTLRRTADLSPEHISAYSLILEEGTPFYERYAGRGAADGEDLSRACAAADAFQSSEKSADTRRQRDGQKAEGSRIPPLPGEDAEREMFEMTAAVLAEYGYMQYEISNYAKPGRACRHNTGYWTGVEYLGFGLGASSYLRTEDLPKDLLRRIFKADGQGPRPEQDAAASGADADAAAVRFRNTENMAEYLRLSGDPAAVRKGAEMLDLRGLAAEFMILGLRMTGGVSEKEFARRFGKSVDQVYGGEIRRHLARGLLERTTEDGGRLRLTRRGLSLANVVMADLL